MIKRKGSSVKCWLKTADSEIRVFPTFKDVPVEEWSRVLNKNFFLCPAYLNAFEEDAPLNVMFRYALVSVKSVNCCAIYMQIIEIDKNNINDILSSTGLSKTKNAILKGYLSGDKKIKLLICGNAFVSGEHGFCFDENVISQAKAIDFLNKSIKLIINDEQHRDPISFVLIKDFYESAEGFSKRLLKKNYTGFHVDPNMVLSIDPSWKKFDDYLNSLSSKYRIRSKAIMRLGSEILMKKFDVADILKYEKEIMRLYLELFNKAKFKPSAYSIKTFVALKENLKNNFVFDAYFVKGSLVAFKTYFFVGENNDVEAHLVGFDSRFNKQYELYQNILYDYVRIAIEANSSKVFYGRTALEIKSNIGARPYELTCYIKHVNPFFSFLIPTFIKRLQPSEWTMRSPFKNSSAITLKA